jgi:carboxylate-amine ligase
MPRTGIPERFESYSDFEDYVSTLVQTGCIDDGSRIWWDLRPHPRYDTLEFRICDIPTNVEHTITLAALIQAIVARLTMLHRDNMSWGVHRTAYISENKWRALRYGIDGCMVDFGRRTETPFVQLAEELLEFVEPVVDELGSRWAIEGVHDILATGTSADQQRRVYAESGEDLTAVVDWLVDETLRGVPDDASVESGSTPGHA